MNTVDVIDDETLRARVRKQISEPVRTGAVGTIASHPITALVVGFLLTWGVGGQLSGTISRDREAREKRVVERRLRIEASLRSIESFSQLLNEHTTRAAALVSALRRPRASMVEIRERKRRYDESYVKWRSNGQANLRTARNALDVVGYSPVDSDIVTGLIDRLEALDSLLLHQYDGRIAVGTVPNTARAAQVLEKVEACGRAVIDQLYYRQAVQLTSDHHTPKSRRLFRKAEQEDSVAGVDQDFTNVIKAACGGADDA